jgi:hypothetical protein
MNGVNAVTPNDLPNLLDQLRREKFYGRVSFDFRDGELALIRTERTQIVTSNRNNHQTLGVNHERKSSLNHS